MAYTVITKESKNKMYVIAYRHIPIFEIGVTVPDYSYYLQYVDKKQQIFDTSLNPPKMITFGNVMELEEDKIRAISDTVTIIEKIMSEI
jgi:hypothetical protein